MGIKGNKRHIKSISAPRYFGAEKKRYAYIAKPLPGRHTLARSVTLNLMLKKLGVVENRREANIISKEGKIKVNDKPVKNVKYPLGFNDVVEISGFGKFVVGVDKKARADFSKHEDKKGRILKVVGKYIAGKGEMMIRLHDGTIAKGGKDAVINDSVTVGNGAVTNIIKLREGSDCMVIDGVHVGTVGKIVSIKEGSRTSKKSVSVESSEGEHFDTSTKNIIVLG